MQTPTTPALWLVDLIDVASAIESAAATHGLAASLDGIVGDRRIAHLALRLLLSEAAGIDAARAPFLAGPEGKPSLAPAVAGLPGLEFSLAHAGGVALIALSHGLPVGVDIEAPRPVRISDRRRAELEAAARSLRPDVPLPREPTDAGFLQAWVRLEALAKATGEGIGSLLGRLREGAEPIAATTIAGRPVVISDLYLPLPRTLYAAIAAPGLAADGPPPPVSLFAPASL